MTSPPAGTDVMPQLTVAFCTCSREASLARSLAALLLDLSQSRTRAQILVVDDGDLGEAVDGLRRDVTAHGHEFRYVRKDHDRRGLYRSRLEAVLHARAPILLFLDDDAEVGIGYCSRVIGRLSSDPSLVGVGGVDAHSLPLGLGRLGTAYARAFMLSGRGPGLLGPSGHNHSQASWRSQRSAFDSEYLHGCNMAYRTRSLSSLPTHPWLEGHSPCEDLVVSAEAARAGRLVVDPDLPVRHMSVPGGRGQGAARLLSRLRAQHEFAIRYRTPSAHVLLWSLMGLLIKDLGTSLCGRSAFATHDVVRSYGAFALGLRGGARR